MDLDQIRDQLAPFMLGDDPSEHRRALATVVTLKAHGRIWEAFSNGHFILMRPTPFDDRGFPEHYPNLDKFLTIALELPTHRVSRCKLIDDAPDLTGTCPECGGRPGDRRSCPQRTDGQVECECDDCGNVHRADCEACDGSGVVDSCSHCHAGLVLGGRDKVVRVGGSAFDPRYLKMIFRLDGAGNQIDMAIAGELDAAAFQCGEWRGVLMPMRAGEDAPYVGEELAP